MDIKVLRHFLVIAEKHSISNAANYLHMSQPTLSRQIGELERDLGVTLFTRGPREITMTQDGHYLVARAKDIIALVDKTTNNLHAGEGTIHGELNIGAVESTKLTSCMKVIDAIIQDFPDVRIQLQTGSNSEVQAQLDSGVLDFGIVVGKMPLHQYSALEFPETECWGLSLPKDHALANLPSVTIEQTADLPILIPEEIAIHENLQQRWTQAPHQTRIAGTYNRVFNALSLVNNGHVSALSLEQPIDTESHPNVTFKKFTPEINEPIVMIWQNSLTMSTVGQIFIERMQEALQNNES